LKIDNSAAKNNKTEENYQSTKRSEVVEPPAKKLKNVEFNEKCKHKFLWLRTESSDDGLVMFCTVCEKDKADIAYTRGCKRCNTIP